MSRLTGRREERGAILVLSVIGVIVAVIATALAVDLGSLAQEKRSDQKVADLVALDAVRGLNDLYVFNLGRLDITTATLRRPRVKVLADESAIRNGFNPVDVANAHDLQVDLGIYDTTKPDNFRATCPPLGGGSPGCTGSDDAADAVKVTITSDLHFDFVHGDRTLTVTAVARQGTLVPPPVTTTTTVAPAPTTTTTVPPTATTASFSLGSSLLNLSTSSSTLLNPVVGQMIGGTVNLSLVSWQGLAAGGVTLGALQTELANLGFTVGSVSQLLNANLTAAQLYRATANALTVGGGSANLANANVLNILRVAAGGSGVVKLANLVKVQAGTDDAAVLGTSLNLLQLVTGSAEVANGTNTVSIPGVGIAVPGVASTGLSLKVTELPQVYIGPVGGSVTTGQVDMTVTTNLNLDVSVGLSVVHVTGPLPVGLQLAGATGTLTSATCSGSKGIGVTADPKAFSGAAQVTNLHTTLLGLPLLDVQTTSATPSVDGPASLLSFSYPAQFTPPASPPFSKHAGSQPVGLQSLTTVTPGTVTLLGALPLFTTAGDVVTAVMNALHPVLGNVDSGVLTPLLTALGLDVGGADVTALGLNCPSVAPPSTTTTTTAPPPPVSTTTTTVLPGPDGSPKLVS